MLSLLFVLLRYPVGLHLSLAFLDITFDAFLMMFNATSPLL